MLFIDDQSRIDKEALRTYTAAQLSKCVGELERLVYGEENRQFWDGLHNLIGTMEDEKVRDGYRKVERQLLNWKWYLAGWLETSVASPERFEMFVQTKANELKSGDEKRYYFWAMQVSHDQLVALVTVVERLMEKIKVWVKQKPKVVMEDPICAGLVVFGLEDQVYLEAGNIHKKRRALSAR